jgi:hypothetical protein
VPLSGDIIVVSDLPYVIAGGYGQRTTVTPSASTWTTTEAGSLRLDGLTLKAARMYEIRTNPLVLVPSVIGDVINVRIRVNNAGVATTASTEIGHIRAYGANVSQTDARTLTVPYFPPADTTTASVLLTLERAAAGGSSLGVRMWGNGGNESQQLWVVDMGPAPTNAGVVI